MHVGFWKKWTYRYSQVRRTVNDLAGAGLDLQQHDVQRDGCVPLPWVLGLGVEAQFAQKSHETGHLEPLFHGGPKKVVFEGQLEDAGSEVGWEGDFLDG